MQLDRAFVLVEPNGPELVYLREMGLAETCRRQHPGQGIENVCFCFPNMFFECLWVTDIREATSNATTRTALFERSQWRVRKTSPIGLAWRNSAGEPSSGIPTWTYKPPYLPEHMGIEVAVESDDPRQPMMFRSPGNTPPAQWPAERRGAMQEACGLGNVISVIYKYPVSAPPGPGLLTLASRTILAIAPAADDFASITFAVERTSAAEPLQIALPLPVR